MRSLVATVASEKNPLQLSGGGQLSHVDIAYQTYGKLNEAKDNVILVFHALTGSQHIAGDNLLAPEAGHFWTDECRRGWWDSMVGVGKNIDTAKYFVVCANYLGGCYGSTGPTGVNSEVRSPWGDSFPEISTTDIVNSQMRLLDCLGVERLHAVVGGSLGGLLALETACRFPARVQKVLTLCSGMKTPLFQKLLVAEQIFAIESDPHFERGRYNPMFQPLRALALARMISHKSFVNLETLELRVGDELRCESDFIFGSPPRNALESYMRHHAAKFAARFDANSYLRILRAWSGFDLRRHFAASSVDDVLANCRNLEFQIFGVEGDLCFPVCEQEELAQRLSGLGIATSLHRIRSEKGHDAFLCDAEKFGAISRFLEKGAER